MESNKNEDTSELMGLSLCPYQKLNSINTNMNVFDELEIDPQIEKDFNNLMKDCPTNILNSNWEMNGEYFKKFSIYEESYESKVTNCVQ